MNKRFSLLTAIFLTVACLAVLSPLAASASTLASRPPPVPIMPSNLKVTDGSSPYLRGHAVGTQNYICQLNVTSGTYSWTFVAPAATLYNDKGKQIATHYAGPTWQYRDGSTVVGLKVASSTVDPTAVPWLLLTAKSTTLGPDGGDRLIATTDIQRINTTGGLAPTTGCDGTTVGAAANVPYTADYHFYEFRE